jgi:hypothetical protein
VAVVSEPPWLNFASGTAARNGTTSHTINFGWTSTSGSLLVVIMHGAVTHTVSGWTEQAQPVATGELSLFTKTSAGDSSIAVTHNGSNYPVNYVIYEFPTGSTFTGIDSTTGSDDTMPGLSGLPGTEQVIIGALGRVTVGSETNGSISPSAPWIEDGDLYAAASGTDGSYLAVVRQINVTSASITPTIAPTYSGTWSNGSREKISAAFDVAAAPAEVAATGVATAVGVATAAAVKTVPVVARCVASVAATVTPAKVSPTVAQSLAAPGGYVTAMHVAVSAGVAVTAPTGATVAVKRLPVSGVAVAAVTVVGVAAQPGGPQPAAGRCTAAATCTGRAGRRTVRPNSGTTSRPFAGITYRP